MQFMKKKFAQTFWLFTILNLTIPGIIFCQENQNRRLKIGVAFSGGGAKGLAHIGVLKVLEEVGIPIDYISGTSMGSIIGGLYACGYSSAQIEKIVKTLNWSELLLDEISRKNISIEEKEDFGKYVGEFPLLKWKVQIPKGLVGGQKVSMMLSRLTWHVHNIDDFDKLPIPFHCVATDIVNIKPVVLKSGYLPDAIRASMAIPSFFHPIEIDSNLLVDGGVLRNLPVQDVRDMGADIVIGSEVSATLYTRDQLNSAFEIMDQATSFQSNISNKTQEALCNILIKPDIGKYNMFSFDAADSLIGIGEKAAREKITELRQLADTLRKMGYLPKVIPRPSNPDSLFITHIKLEGISSASKNLVLGNLQLPDSGWIAQSDLEHGIERVYGTRFFERVNYKITPSEYGSLLTLRLKEQPSNFFKFGLNYSSYLKAAILLNVTYRNLLGDGSRLVFDLRLGEYPAFITKYTIQTSAHPNLGFGLRLQYNSFLAKFYSDKKLLIANFDINHFSGEMDFLSAVSNAFLIRTGIQMEKYDITHQIEAYDTINYSLSSFSWYARFRFDTNDKTIFPRKGDYFNAEIKSVLTSNFHTGNWNGNFWRLHARYEKNIPIDKRLVLSTGLSGGFNFYRNLHFINHFYLGGDIPSEMNIFSFKGMNLMAISAQNILISTLKVRAELWKDKYLTFTGNIGRSADDYRNFFLKQQNYWGIGVSAGIKTIIGPVEFTLSRGSVTRELISEIQIGFNF
jgi:NTE family protein